MVAPLYFLESATNGIFNVRLQFPECTASTPPIVNCVTVLKCTQNEVLQGVKVNKKSPWKTQRTCPFTCTTAFSEVKWSALFKKLHAILVKNDFC